MLQNGYKISKLFYDEVQGLITSIQFENNLIVPIIYANSKYKDRLPIGDMDQINKDLEILERLTETKHLFLQVRLFQEQETK